MNSRACLAVQGEEVGDGAVGDRADREHRAERALLHRELAGTDAGRRGRPVEPDDDLRGTCRDRRLQQVGGAAERAGHEIGAGPPGGQGEVEDDVGAQAGQEVGQLGHPHVEVVELQRPDVRGPGRGQVGQRAGREVVDDVDGVALGQQPVDEVRAEEPGAADDEDPHAGIGRRVWLRLSPASTTASTPRTTSTSVAPAPTRAPDPSTDDDTLAPASTSTRGSRTLAETVAPAAIREPAPTTLSETVPSMVAPGPMRGSRTAGRRPLTESRLAWR